jgi:hypothetical protein
LPSRQRRSKAAKSIRASTRYASDPRGERHIEFKRGGRNAVVALTEMTEGEIVELVRQAQSPKLVLLARLAAPPS